ncbi:acetate--CoA ligase family protein [Neobacillus niacini]|uniref:acetate--CoA ligase family protein n=1 Tax=Neobacillus niacini TaxID=86668 RepID=UPI003000C45C
MSLNQITVELEIKPVSIKKLISPRSIAIVGASATPGSAGNTILKNLERFNYSGEIHLVNKKRTEIEGKFCVPSIEDLPEGIDAVVLCVPFTAVVESVKASARRKAGSVMIFAAGFAEVGEAGKLAQAQITEIGRENEMMIAGPNCMGLTNFVDNVPLTFAPGLKKTEVKNNSSLCILSQSGGMMSNLREIAQARGISLTHAISTGNEAIAGVEDYLAYLIEDESTKVITMYVEHIRRPKLFLDLSAKARKKGKTIVLLHPGRSEASREAAQSHTGSLVGDYTVIKTLLEQEAVIMVETMEELVDVSWFLTSFEKPPVEGAAILTDSGAVKGFALDYCDTVGLSLPELSEASKGALDQLLPEFSSATNPLDVTAQVLSDMSLYTSTARCLLDDSKIGSLMIIVLPGSPHIALEKVRAALPAISSTVKPTAYVVMGEGSPLQEEVITELMENGIPFFRSPERAMRALAILTKYGKSLKKVNNLGQQAPIQTPVLRTKGVIPEYAGKDYFAKIGIPVPKWGLAKEVESAIDAARSIGFPVVLKAQSSELAHKSDVGGVIVGIKDETELAEAWKRLHSNIGKARPDLELDGVLVEKMGEKGIEMVVGARRDSEWGPIVMVGLGGIWIEVLKDVRFMSPKLTEEYIEQEILALKSADLLRGARGSAPADVKALTQVVAKVGQLMNAVPEIEEIDINPVMVYPDGQGVVALDALIVTSE